MGTFRRPGTNVIHVGIGHDTVWATSSGSTNTIYGDAGEDTVYGGDGNDTVCGGDDDDELRGGSGNDTIEGGTGSDEIYGEGGNDIITPGQEGDTSYGGSGDDTFAYEGGDQVFVETTGQGTDHIELPVGVDSGDIEFYRVGNASNYDLLILVDGLGSIQLPNFFDSGGNFYGTLESLEILGHINICLHQLYVDRNLWR